ncbi:MAG: hypothetical protein AAF430_09195 [Myxococcota bacterium]
MTIAAVGNFIVYGMFAFFGGIFALIVLAVLFGKRIERKWDYEADFRDERGREIGELDVELFRVIEDKRAAVQPDFQLKVKFVLRHPALTPGQGLVVRLAGEPIFEQTLSESGRVLLREDALCSQIKSPRVGDLVTVEVGGAELFSEPLRRD